MTQLKDYRDVLSAWNWSTGRYDYYKPPFWAKRPYGDTTPTQPARVTGQLGEAPEDSAASMPLGSLRVGSGDEAQGQIVQHPREGGAMLQQFATPAIAGALIGYAMTSAKSKKTKGAAYGAGGGIVASLVMGFVRNAMGSAPAAGAGGFVLQAGAGAVGAASLLHFLKP